MSEAGGVKKEMRRGGILQEYIQTIVGDSESARRRHQSRHCLTHISCTMWVGGSSESNHAVEAEDWVVNPVAPIEC